jgi:hypothetical protein
VIAERIVVQLTVSIQDQLLLRSASKFRFSTKVASHRRLFPKKGKGGQSQKEKGDVKATKWTSEHGILQKESRRSEQLKATSCFRLG